MPTPAIYWLADRMAPAVRRQFLASVLRLQGRISIPALTTAVGRQGWPASIEKAFADFEVDVKNTVGATLNQTWEKAALATEKEILTRVGIRASFNLVNPLAVLAAEQRSSLLITSITSETRSAVQQVIRKSIVDGIPPRTAAIEIRPLVGLTPRQTSTVQKYRASLRAAGKTVQESNAAASRYSQKLLRQRGLTIARTETIRASVDGQQDAWLSAKFNRLIPDDAQQQWLVADDEKLCPICEKLDGKTAPLGSGFVSGSGVLKGPPAHPNCRCALVMVFSTKKKRR